MRRLLWLLLAGCSSSGNTVLSEPAEPPDFTCSYEPPPGVRACPDSYAPATDRPEQTCLDAAGQTFVGSSRGFAFIWRVWADGSTECYYDGGSGALVGFSESAGNNYRCSGSLPEVDPNDGASLTPVPCIEPSAATP